MECITRAAILPLQLPIDEAVAPDIDETRPHGLKLVDHDRLASLQRCEIGLNRQDSCHGGPLRQHCQTAAKSGM